MRVGALYIGEGSVPVTGEAVTVVTMEDLPAGPPKEVVVTEVSSSETDLEVKWQVCCVGFLGEVILLYIIHVHCLFALMKECLHMILSSD